MNLFTPTVPRPLTGPRNERNEPTARGETTEPARPDASTAADQTGAQGSTGRRMSLPSGHWLRHRATLLAAAVAAPTLWGVTAGIWMPRGPLTTAEALWSIVLSLVVGAVAGLAARTRWMIVAAPAAFALAFEVLRADLAGPTVDGIETSTYGAMAFVVGRGVHGLLALIPLALGATYGAAWVRRSASDPDERVTVGHRARQVVAGLTVVGLAVFSVALARPAQTDPIVDADGEPVAGSIAELTTVDVDGHELGLMIRGHSTDNPVLLFLAGGPGGSELGAMRRHLAELEQHVTVVTWDQRGSGSSYDTLDPTETITLGGFVDDTLAVTDYLRERFDQESIYLAGQSWGSTLGILAVQERPEAYRAFIGTGQMVSQRVTDRIFYDDTLAWARRTGEDGLVDELLSIGPPPYEAMFPYETALSYEHQVYPYDHTPNSEGEGGFSENLFVEEYALIDQLHALGAFLDVFAALYPQLQDIDFRETATELDVPVFFVQGAHEAGGRAELFDEWYPMIDAPIKDVAVLDSSGHRPLFEQPAEFVDYLSEIVIPATDGRPADPR